MKMRVLGYSDISGTSRGREAKDDRANSQTGRRAPFILKKEGNSDSAEPWMNMDGT